ncbi:MAG TPA: secretin N-terminal domain-containing protein, partial [Longimicrobiales bacterium]
MKCARAAGLVLAMNCLIAGLTPQPALAQETGQRLQYVAAPLRDVLRSLAATLGINLLLPATLPDVRVTYASATSLSPAQIGGVLESLLETHGLILITEGPTARVISADKAPRTGPVSTGRTLPLGSLGLITHVFPLQAVVPEEAVALLKTVASPAARIEVVPRGTAVLITDQSRNVARYLELLREIDVAAQGEAGLRTYVIRLKHANATELAITIAALFGVTLPADLQDRSEALEGRGLSSELRQFRARESESLALRAGLRAGLPVAAAPREQQRD